MTGALRETINDTFSWGMWGERRWGVDSFRNDGKESEGGFMAKHIK